MNDPIRSQMLDLLSARDDSEEGIEQTRAQGTRRVLYPDVSFADF